MAAIVANIPGSKGIVGPWAHLYPHTAVPGPQVWLLNEALRWRDPWLKAVAHGAGADPDASAQVRPGRRLGAGSAKA